MTDALGRALLVRARNAIAGEFGVAPPHVYSAWPNTPNSCAGTGISRGVPTTRPPVVRRRG